MKTVLTVLVWLALVLTGCHTADLHFMKREDTINGYASAIRWGEFEKAAEFQTPSRRTRLDEAWLKNIRVTGYDVQFRKESEGSKVLEQKVEIRYLNDLNGSEKILIDRQLWKFYEDKSVWMLESDLPKFR